MNTSVKAFAPANISCFFKPYVHKNPRWAGSYGMGFTVDKGVVVTVTKYSSSEALLSREVSSRQARTIPHKVFFNGKKINFPTVASVLSALGVEPLHVEIESALPLGCGFGLSGASALATAYAANKLFALKKTKKALAIIAHTAEVKNKTGLGDVVNQFYGGVFLKTKPSSYFVAQRIPITNIPVYCKYFSRLSTKAVLTNKSLKDKIEMAGLVALHKAEKLLTKHKKIVLRDVIKIGKDFVINAGLLKDKKTIEVIDKIEKSHGHASMIILGNAVYSDIPFDGSIKLIISNKGAHLL